MSKHSEIAAIQKADSTASEDKAGKFIRKYGRDIRDRAQKLGISRAEAASALWLEKKSNVVSARPGRRRIVRQESRRAPEVVYRRRG